MFELDVNEKENTFCIRGENVSLQNLRIIKSVVMCNFIDDIDYILSRKCGAFLQSYSEINNYFMVEFWSEDHDAIMDFIDYVNSKIAS